MGLFGGDTIIGLDLGTRSIKAVQVEATKSGWAITGAAAVPTPRGAIADGSVADAKALEPALKQLLGHRGVRGSTIVAAINYTASVAVRRMPVPAMTRPALRKMMQTQPDQFGISGGKENVVDFEILGAIEGAEGPQQDAVLVSAPRASIEERIRALESAGLDPIALDIEPFALMRSLVESRPSMVARDGALAILDMGAGHTDVTVVRGTNYIFTRPIPFGGDGFTEVIRQALQCTVEEADALKANADLRWLLAEGLTDQETPAYKATAAVKSVLDDCLKEVRNSILYYHAQLPEEDTGMVESILLTGGTACMLGLPEYMQAAFNLPVERPDFSKDFDFPITSQEGGLSSEHAALFALALGLAVKEPADRARSQQRSAAKSRRKKRVAASVPLAENGTGS